MCDCLYIVNTFIYGYVHKGEYAHMNKHVYSTLGGGGGGGERSRGGHLIVYVYEFLILQQLQQLQ